VDFAYPLGRDQISQILLPGIGDIVGSDSRKPVSGTPDEPLSEVGVDLGEGLRQVGFITDQELADLLVLEGLGELHLFLLTLRVIMLASLPSLPI
jgi:hypothetical protein